MKTPLVKKVKKIEKCEELWKSAKP